MSRGVIVAAMMACLTYASTAGAVIPVTINDIKQVVPDAYSHSHKVKPLDHYVVKNKQGETVGLAFLTTSIPPDVKAYVDEIDVLVGMNPKGEVTGVEILSHAETPSYIEIITSSGFLRRFVGRTVNRGFDDIETVTGATISSKAIKHDIQTAAFEVTRRLIDSGVLRKESGKTPNPFDLIPILAVLALIGGVFAALFIRGNRWLRYGVWIVSAAVVGFWLNSPITVDKFVDLRNGTYPTHIPLLILFVFAIVASLIKGNLYCAYLCPFGALQELAGRLRLPKCKPSDRTARNAAWLRWIILLVSGFAIANSVDAFRSVEPFALCFSRSMDVLVWVQAGTILVIALFLKRPWCRFFCPTGAILDLLNQLGRKARHFIKRKA